MAVYALVATSCTNWRIASNQRKEQGILSSDPYVYPLVNLAEYIRCGIQMTPRPIFGAAWSSWR